tara:strand:+ start:1558 stop:1815 length:258 start_codon:yes stop_codon:yes gene_type:complete
MIIDIKIPKMGQATVEVEIITWHVSPGSVVTPGSILAEIESEKTTIELESEVSGVVQEILVEADCETTVGAVVCRIKTNDSLVGG